MIGDTSTLLERVREAQLEVEIHPDNGRANYQLLELYRLAVEHFSALGKQTYIRHFLKCIEARSQAVQTVGEAPTLASRGDLHLHVEYARQNSSDVARKLLSVFKQENSSLQTQIIETVQHQKRVIAERLAKRKQNREVMQRGSEVLSEQSRSDQQKTLPSTASGPTRCERKAGVEGQPQHKKKKKSKFRIMSKNASDNRVPLDLFPL